MRKTHGQTGLKETNFLDIYSKNSELLNIMRIRPVGAKLLQTDRRVDMTTLIDAFRNFPKVP